MLPKIKPLRELVTSDMLCPFDCRCLFIDILEAVVDREGWCKWIQQFAVLMCSKMLGLSAPTMKSLQHLMR
jgi:hypothetical protein